MVSVTAATEVVTLARALAGTGHPRGCRLRAGRSNLRLLYSEIIQNLAGLVGGGGAHPPQLVVQEAVYAGLLSGGRLGMLGLRDEEVGCVMRAYGAIAVGRVVFSQDWLALAGIRARGNDYRVLELLAQGFRDAEAIVRPRAWTSSQRCALEAALDASGLRRRVVLPSIRHLLGNALASVPGAVWIESSEWMMSLYRLT
jgi:hypothetical protein